MKDNRLGEFEEVVLLTVGILHGDAYSVTIKDDMEERLSRTVSIGALQVTLRRLEKKGFLSSHHGETEESRGGRPKLFFELTSFGKQSIVQMREERNKLWNALPQVIFDLK